MLSNWTLDHSILMGAVQQKAVKLDASSVTQRLQSARKMALGRSCSIPRLGFANNGSSLRRQE
jgi:hypothetical protein